MRAFSWCQEGSAGSLKGYLSFKNFNEDDMSCSGPMADGLTAVGWCLPC